MMTPDITLARFGNHIQPVPALNRITGTFADRDNETAFLTATWRDRRKLGLAVTAVIFVSTLVFAIAMIVPSGGPSPMIVPLLLVGGGIVSTAVAMWCLISNRSGYLLDFALFLPSVTLSAYLVDSYGDGGMPWVVIPSILMSSMFIYGVFLPHRPPFAFAALGVMLAAYLFIGLFAGAITQPVSGLMFGGIWVACALMVRNSAISRRTKFAQKSQLEDLTEKLDQNLQDLELENRAVERAASENAALADELALARMAAEENTALLEVILNNVSQGVLVYGADAKVIKCNDRFREFLRLPDELSEAGTPVEKLFEHGFSQGIVGSHGDLDSAIESVRKYATTRDFEPVAYERQTGIDRFIEIRLMPLPGGGVVSTLSDITERKLAEEHIRFKSLHDSLTGLANRDKFKDRLDAAIARSKRVGHYAALAMIDLDRFKPVNDTYGHPAGDAVLQEVAKLITASVREIDTVARLGGDEFAVIFDGIAVLKDVSKPIDRILECLSAPIHALNHDIQVGASIGVAFYPLDAENGADLEKVADRALLDAKRAGRNRCFYSQRNYLSGLPTVVNR